VQTNKNILLKEHKNMDNNKQNDKIKNDKKSKNTKGDSQDKSIKSGPLFQNPFKNEQ